MNDYTEIIDDIPLHLRQYIVDQNYERYTYQDQAVWRYIMRLNISFLKKYAHPSYLDGLEKTGISIDHIPSIQEMNDALGKIGWKAVIVDGFLPPAVFMEFQFHKILVISADIRTIKHILYTPAPDIVHEAAGHAPIIADEKYAQFLQKFGEYGTKAFSSQLDHEIYEAIRHLSIIKEYPETTEDEIYQAEQDLNSKIEKNINPSEMTLLSRLHWWTVEYGLIGKIDDFKLYGAGLLSSVGESKGCLSPKVRKIELDLHCIEYNYDITKQQPQLFVNRDWNHLLNVLEDFANTMAFRKSGYEALKIARDSKSVATIEFASGIQVSGKLVQIITDQQGLPVFIKTEGGTSLSYENKQLSGHGSDYHKEGYSSPFGTIDGKSLESMSEKELKDTFNIAKNNQINLKFDSGIKVNGIIKDMIIRNQKLILLSLDNCSVNTARGDVLFEPSWGSYDMIIGSSVSSVFAGTADKLRHNIFPAKSEKIAIPIKYSDKEKELHGYYKDIRQMREQNAFDEITIKDVFEKSLKLFPDEWLLPLEILELCYKNEKVKFAEDVRKHLERIKQTSEEMNEIISNGLSLLN